MAEQDNFFGFKNLRFCFAVSSQLNVPATAANLEDLTKALNTNICVDRIGQPRVAHLLLKYQPLIGNFLDGPTVPRLEETPIEPTALYVAQLASDLPQVDHPDLVPTGEVSEMASPVDLFEVIGKKSKGATSSKSKGKTKQGAQPKKSRRAVFEVIAAEETGHREELRSVPSAEESRPPQAVEEVKTEQVEELVRRPKRARVVDEQTNLPSSSSSVEIWALKMTVAGDPVITSHTVFDTFDVEFSARVAQALTKAFCLLEDNQVWEDMSSGRMF